MNEEEVWRPIVGYEGRYEVSNHGRVRSIIRRNQPPLIRSLQVLQANGYVAVSLNRPPRRHPSTYTVHRLVMAAFVGPCPEGMEVRHLDGNRQNPRLDNLSYGTHSRNQHDRRRHGTDHEVNKTHCPSGHPYDEENTYSPPSRPTARYCRACSRGRKHTKAPRVGL